MARPESAETVGERIKRLRTEKGMSQRELAVPGVSYAYISRLESNTRVASVKALRKLAARLDVTPAYLEYGDDSAGRRDDPAWGAIIRKLKRLEQLLAAARADRDRILRRYEALQELLEQKGVK